MAGSAAAAPSATSRAAPECATRHCVPAAWSDWAARDMALLTVKGGTAPLLFYYASDGGPRPVRIVRDAGGCDYVLLEYGVGRGPGASVWLAVLRLTDRLALLRKVRVRYWLSPGNAAEYRYRIDKPFGGGLTLELTRHFTGKDTRWHYPPAGQIISIPAD